MTTTGQHLAETCLDMLDRHGPDLVDRFVAEGYVDHDASVDDGREADRRLWGASFAALPPLGGGAGGAGVTR